MRVHGLLAAAALIGGVGLACGGAADSGLFGGPSANSGSNGGTSDNDGGSSGGGVDAGNGNPGTGEDASPGHPDAGAIEDASPLPDAAPPPKDSGPPPAQDPGVKCGSGDCSVPSEACCRRQVNGNFSYMCLPTGTCQGLNTPSLEIPCDDSTDCATAGSPGQVCCVTIGGGPGGGNAASEVVCRDPSECTQQQSRTPACENDAGVCPQGTTCRTSSQTLPGYRLCL